MLMIGTDFVPAFFPEGCHDVQIDIHGEQLGRRANVDYGFVGDTKSTLRALAAKLSKTTTTNI